MLRRTGSDDDSPRDGIDHARLRERLRATDDSTDDLDAQTRAALNRDRARRRATGRFQRYGVHNLLGNLNTLTYRCVACNAGPCVCGLKAQPERDRVVHDWQKFRKRRARRVGREPVAAVIEHGSTTGRIHLHVATRERWDQDELEALWGHGFVVPGRHDPEALSMREARAVAGYCSSYAGKALDAGHGRQSYFVAQGFQPTPVKAWARSEREALATLKGMLGGFDSISRSDEWGDDYAGPPALSVRLG